jgi:SAM-dependent methyltransferase
MCKMANPWKEIPLTDYEKHMSHPSVGQLELLSILMRKYFHQLQPESTIVLGVAGGNGLEHIEPLVTKKIIGIDINQDYLDATARRHSSRLNALELLHLDISKNLAQICSVKMIWAALIIEYVGIENCLLFALNNLMVPGGHLIVTVQSSRQMLSVSPTGVESVEKVGKIFQPVDTKVLLDKAEQMGFKLVVREENELPNGKSFITFHFTM